MPDEQVKTGPATQAEAEPPASPRPNSPGPFKRLCRRRQHEIVQAFAAQFDKLLAAVRDLHPTMARRLNESIAMALRECSRPSQLDSTRLTNGDPEV